MRAHDELAASSGYSPGTVAGNWRLDHLAAMLEEHRRLATFAEYAASLAHGMREAFDTPDEHGNGEELDELIARLELAAKEACD